MVQFTDTLSGGADALVARPIADAPDTTFQSLTGLASGLGKALVGKGPTAAQAEAARQASASKIVNSYASQISDIDTAIEQGGMNALDGSRQKKQISASIYSQYPELGTQLAKAEAAQLGTNPLKDYADLIDQRAENELAQQKFVEDTVLDEAYKKNNIKVIETADGAPDIPAMKVELQKFSAVSQSINNTNLNREKLGVDQQGSIEEYWRGIRATTFNAATDPEKRAQLASPQEQAAAEVLGNIMSGKTETPERRAFAKNVYSSITQQKLMGFEGTLESALTTDNVDILKTTANNGYLSAIHGILDSGGDAEEVKLLGEMVKGKELKVKNVLYEDPLFGPLLALGATEVVAQKLKGAADSKDFKAALKRVQTNLGDIDKITSPAGRDEDAAANLGDIKAHEPLNYTKEPNRKHTLNQMYSALEPAFRSGDTTNVHKAIAAMSTKDYLTSYQDIIANVASPEEYATATKAMSDTKGQLAKSIQGAGPEAKPEYLDFFMDPETGVVWAKTNDKLPEFIPTKANMFLGPMLGTVLPAGIDALSRGEFVMDDTDVKLEQIKQDIEVAVRGENNVDFLLTSLNSYQVLNSMQNAQGVQGVPLPAIYDGIQMAPVPSSGRGITTQEGALVILPKNGVHEGLQLVPSMAKPPKVAVTGGGLFGGMSSAISAGLNTDPLGDLITETGNDEVGNIISQIEQEPQQMNIVDRVIAREGGFVNDPVDRGGATNFGITKKTLEAHRGEKVSVDDVKSLTKEEASEIYVANFLTEPKIDQLPAPIQEFVFDFAVNSGPANAIKQLQKAAGVKADGKIGPATIKAAESVDIKQLASQRISFLTNIVKRDPSQARFINGWVNRVLEFL